MRPAVGESSERSQHAQRAFCTLDTKLRFARDPRSLFTPPFRKPEIFTMRTVGTISWFFEPISTCGEKLGSDYVVILDLNTSRLLTAVRTRNSSDVMYRRSVASSFMA